MKTVSSIKTATFLVVTPAIASKWLNANTDNRYKRKTHITRLAAAMCRGEWLTTHQGVAFSECGKLVDGQHRLEAIVKANLSIEMLVVMGLGEDTFKAIDVGVTRTTADVTHLPQRKAEVGRFFASIGLPGASSKATADQVLLATATGVGRVHDKLVAYCSGTTKYYASTPIRAAAVSLVMNGYDEDAVFKIYADLVNQNYSEMTTISQVLVRQVSSTKVVARNTADAYTRGLKVLNPDNAGLQRLNVGASDVASAMAYCKSTIQRNIPE